MIKVDLLAEVLLFVCAVPVNLYAIFYLFRPWYSTPQGRALMIKAWGNAMLVDLGLATLTFGQDYPGRDTIRAVGFGLFAVGNWYLFLALMRSDPYSDYPPRRWWHALRRRF